MNKQIINESDLGSLEANLWPDAFIPIEDAKGSLVEPLKGSLGLSLDEMRSNVEARKKEFEVLESRLNKVRQSKLQAVEADDRQQVVSLLKEDVLITKQLNSIYELWQNAKKNYEYALTDKENLIVAEGLLSEHDSKINERTAKANVFLNMVAEFNNQIALVDDAAKEFKGIQLAGLNGAERLVMELKQMHLGRIGKVEVQQLSEDNYGSIVPIKQSLRREVALLENGLVKVEGIIANIRKGIYSSLLRRGD